MSAVAFEAPSGVDEISLRKNLVRENLHLTKAVAARISWRLPPGVTKDDLVSVGTLGLIDAAVRFELKDATLEGFRGYARIRVRGAIVDHLRELDPVPRSARQTSRRIDDARAR